MLYEPTKFDALIDEPWVPARVEAAISAIVADADAAFDPTALSPAHEWDAREKRCRYPACTSVRPACCGRSMSSGRAAMPSRRATSPPPWCAR